VRRGRFRDGTGCRLTDLIRNRRIKKRELPRKLPLVIKCRIRVRELLSYRDNDPEHSGECTGQARSARGQGSGVGKNKRSKLPASAGGTDKHVRSTAGMSKDYCWTLIGNRMIKLQLAQPQSCSYAAPTALPIATVRYSPPVRPIITTNARG
jgi:hypothetical protein